MLLITSTVKNNYTDVEQGTFLYTSVHSSPNLQNDLTLPDFTPFFASQFIWGARIGRPQSFRSLPVFRTFRDWTDFFCDQTGRPVSERLPRFHTRARSWFSHLHTPTTPKIRTHQGSGRKERSITHTFKKKEKQYYSFLQCYFAKCFCYTIIKPPKILQLRYL